MDYHLIFGEMDTKLNIPLRSIPNEDELILKAIENYYKKKEMEN